MTGATGVRCIGLTAAVVTALLLATVGCKSGTSSEAIDTNAVSDARAGRLPSCSLAPGPSWLINSFSFLGSPFAHDFGDGVPRNALKVLANNTIRKQIETQIRLGTIQFGIHIVQSMDGGAAPLGDGLPQVLDRQAIQTMELLNDPGPGGGGSAAADLDGGVLCADPQQFDINCKSLSHSDAVSVDGGVIEASAHIWPIVAGTFGVGTIAFYDADLQIQKAPPSSTNPHDIDITFYGIWPACSLGSVIGPGGANLLDLVTQLKDDANPFGVQPDFDLRTNQGIAGNDGGLPVFGNVNGITTCMIDGETIQGAKCACDPRINQGYSVALHFEGTAVLVPALCPEN